LWLLRDLYFILFSIFYPLCYIHDVRIDSELESYNEVLDQINQFDQTEVNSLLSMKADRLLPTRVQISVA
jgi:hypothetical protein